MVLLVLNGDCFNMTLLITICLIAQQEQAFHDIYKLMDDRKYEDLAPMDFVPQNAIAMHIVTP